MIAHWLGLAPDTDAPASAARTHVGLVRTINEDRLLDAPDRGLWAIADGMGGHARGDAAAATVVAALAALGRATPGALADALTAADATIRAAVPGSGATVVALALDGARVHLAWAGDSRAYRWRGGALVQLTRDHSVVQELVDAGLLDAAGVADHPQAHVVTRAIGAAERIELDTAVSDLAPGDRFLLCSDGLSQRVPAAAIAAGLGLPTPAAAADALVAAALDCDGSDNVSVIVIAA